MHYLSERLVNTFSIKMKTLTATVALSLGCFAISPLTVVAENLAAKPSSTNNVINNEAQTVSPIKTSLMNKLQAVNHFSANFTQQVFDNDNKLLQQGSGKLIVSKPNKVYWQTTAPEESLIVSDGETLWLYDPFIEQVSAFSYQASVENTPTLLISSGSRELWANYTVMQPEKSSYNIVSNDEQSQVKSLLVKFAGEQISELVITDVTGQTSHITLSDSDYKTAPDEKLFTFKVPKGVHLDDQR